MKNNFFVFLPSVSGIYDLIRATDSEWQIITSQSINANAYVSIFWFFYVDGRVLGMISGLFTYGAYMAHSVADIEKKLNIKNLCIFAFLLQGLVWSFIRFSFSNIYYAIAFLFLIFVVLKKGKVLEAS